MRMCRLRLGLGLRSTTDSQSGFLAPRGGPDVVSRGDGYRRRVRGEDSGTPCVKPQAARRNL